MRTYENVACTVCGCVCDDLRVAVDGGRVVGLEGACHLSEPWLRAQNGRHPPAAQIDGRPAPVAEALARAAEILRDACAPLFYGMARSSSEGQRAAVSLAERVGATIDTAASLCHATSMMAIQEVGESTCTLGEVRNRADLVIYWGSDPLKSHPRHLGRYSTPPGKFVPSGRADRTLVVVDPVRTATAEAADLFVPMPRGADFEALHALRALVRGALVEEGRDTGVPLPLLRELAARMTSCRVGVVFFGLGLSLTGAAHHNVEALLLLVRDLNEHARFFARRMRMQGDVTGADTLLLWQTGYPFGVSLARGFPRYNPGEFTANDMLERGDADACLFVGSEGAERFSDAAKAHLRRVPTVALDHPTEESCWPAGVRFTTAVYGVHRPGTVYRMDGVPIPLRPFLASDYPTDAEVLAGIEAAGPRFHANTSSSRLSVQ
ncbi:MAG TPA: formylmethanofuran dehydrogenase subunit B [Gemmataceae bacterium]|nr:formylmethanofuran dehydrogenase subunit B [Gemmataceae bacterium]